MYGLAAIVGLFVSASTLTGAVSPAGPEAAKPHTIAVVKGLVGTLAQSDTRIAWLRGPENCPQAEVFELRTHRRTTISSRHGHQCHVSFNLGVLAFDGNRVLWQGLDPGLSANYFSIFSAALDDRRTRAVGGAEIEKEHNALDDSYGSLPMAGASGRLFYFTGESEIRTLDGRRSRKVFQAGRAVGLALGGGRLAVLEDRLGSAYHPSWSPDGRSLAWIDSGSLVAANADGSDAKVIAPGTYAGAYVTGYPSWSPDGASLAFMYYSDAGDAWIEVVRADGSGLRRLGAGSEPRWSAGGWIAFVRGNDVYRIESDGSAETRLTTDAIDNTYDPMWSPDGTKLLVQRGARAYVVDALAGGSTPLAPLGASTPVWSPNGAAIAFSAPRANGSRSIAVMNADGSGAHLVSKAPQYAEDFSPAWSADGAQIAFRRFHEDGETSDVLVVGADGTGTHEVSGAPNAADAAWAPNKAVLAWGDPESNRSPRIGGVFVANADGSARTRVAGQDEALVEILDAKSGGLQRTLTGSGTALAVAMSSKYLAVLVGNQSRLELKRYRVDGSALGTTALPAAVDRTSLCIGANVVVYTSKGRVLATDAETGRTHTLARPSVPFGHLSALNHRLVWIEYLKGDRSRIRALDLSR